MGWPLGLRLMNSRFELVRIHDLSASGSFNTLLTYSPSSCTDPSSGLDTESTRSFYHDKSITLGSLIGVSNILELSRRSTKEKVQTLENKKNKSKPWLHSLALCIKLRLGLSPEAERSNHKTHGHNSTSYGPSVYS